MKRFTLPRLLRSLSSKLSPKFWRLLRVALIELAILIPVLPVLAGILYGWVLTTPRCPGLFNSPQDMMGLPYEEITLTAPDGVQVPGWYIESQNGAAIVASPGLDGNRSHALAHFGFLAQEGYGFVVFDQRGCSDRRSQQSLGYNQAQDVRGAVAYLSERDEVEHIGAIGFSAGGAATLLAAAQQPDIAAVVEIGGYANLGTSILNPHSTYTWPDTLMRRGTLWGLRWHTGVNPYAVSPVDVVDDISPRPLLLIYGEYETGSGQRLYAAAGEPTELWIVPGAGHGTYRTVSPDYERRISQFFAETLLETETGN